MQINGQDDKVTRNSEGFPTLHSKSMPRSHQLLWTIKLDSVSTARTSLIAQLVKNLPAVQETSVQFLGQEDSLEKG